ncbi:hypothetical protein NPX13_g10052 [Xylaria arbuscula]|uniref:Uncharacterized protein n=1 Tax=Xylaria arbuscula TaxID=114810 RepID=A0A9W8N5K4_9PEZI|nr:hypothetical protein NPX13_g10052 [Xylaria arbuscula]
MPDDVRKTNRGMTKQPNVDIIDTLLGTHENSLRTAGSADVLARAPLLALTGNYVNSIWESVAGAEENAKENSPRVQRADDVRELSGLQYTSAGRLLWQMPRQITVRIRSVFWEIAMGDVVR